jgi:hypothetical protein
MTSYTVVVNSYHVHSSSPLATSNQVQGARYSGSEVEIDVANLELETDVAALELEMDTIALELETYAVVFYLEMETDV